MKSVGVIIPCFNEEAGIPMLGLALESLDKQLADCGYQRKWIFVDDGSTDGTFFALEKLAQKMGDALVKKHPRNLNLGAALRTGLGECGSCDYVCFLDSDCTYSPNILIPLLKKLEGGADLVTASPYHPEGLVEGVPGWRIFLSKTLSYLYRILTGGKIHTYTAMVRAQRIATLSQTKSERSDFTYLTEVLLKALRSGLRVEEVPATLRARQFGVSKMKTLRTIRKHLELIVQFCIFRKAFL